MNDLRPPTALGMTMALVLVACSSPGGTPAPASPPLSIPSSGGASKIKHVVIVIQENRSFDDLFATFRGADGATYGYNSKGQKVALTKVALKEKDIRHAHAVWVTEYDNGKMDGFDKDTFAGPSRVPAGTYPYQYVDPAQIRPYWEMARRYVLGDHLFQTQTSDSFTAHQDLIAGGTVIDSTHSIIDSPSSTPYGCDSPSGTVTSLIDAGGNYLQWQGPFPCLKYATLRDRLDAAGLSWKYYTPQYASKTGGGIWNAFDAIRAVRYSSEWNENVSVPQTNVIADAQAGKLPAVSWVVPYVADSDHPGTANDAGPSWVAQIVDAIGNNKRLWDSTAIVVVWDDWGGFYDHVKPPQLDSQGLGFRVPMLVISSYAKAGYVSHTQYEFGSILRFVEENWGLQTLGTTDARANSIADCFNFNQPPRAFVPIAAAYSREYFLHEPPTNVPVDDE
ncbi:MAG: hypothetical protein JO359_08745 [Candidatus Eremiobacteraeota bacterium]|nr:hypothetical protein [Candidatus Eremiobacteraeota bacterium]